MNDAHFRQWAVGLKEHPVPVPPQPTHSHSPSHIPINSSDCEMRPGTATLPRQDSYRSAASLTDSPSFEPGALFARSSAWDNISPAGRDLVARLLRVDPHWRITAEQALQHPWMLARSWSQLLSSGGRRKQSFRRHSRASPSMHPHSGMSPSSVPPSSPISPSQSGTGLLRQGSGPIPNLQLTTAATAVDTKGIAIPSSRPAAPPLLMVQGSSLEALVNARRAQRELSEEGTGGAGAAADDWA